MFDVGRSMLDVHWSVFSPLQGGILTPPAVQVEHVIARPTSSLKSVWQSLSLGPVRDIQDCLSKDPDRCKNQNKGRNAVTFKPSKNLPYPLDSR
jgi:hypothetical protein